MKFKFRLEKVLSHKKTEKDIAQRDFAEAQRNYDLGVQALEQLHQEVSDAKKYETEMTVSGGQTAEALKWSDFFLQGQVVKIEMQKKMNRKLIQEVEKKQEILAEKAIEFKTFERLREKSKERFKLEVKKQEIKAIDEMVVMSPTRRLNNE